MLLAAVLLVAAPASAQQRPDVRLVLRTQTTTVTRERPLSIRLRAVNDSERTLRDLAVTLSIMSPARTRTGYAESLEFDFPAFVAKQFPVEGPLEPGGTLSILIPEWRLLSLGDQGESLLYPLRAQLYSDFEPIADLTTSIVYIDDRPQVPLNVALTAVLDAPLVLGPAGVFQDDALERALAPGGWLRTTVSALNDIPMPVTLAVSPILLEQLRAMADGYQVAEPGGLREIAADDGGARRAASVLERIGTVARRETTQLIALPYASPSIPVLAAAGLQEELERQLNRGRATVASILGAEPSPSLGWPPGSNLTPEAVQSLALEGVDSLVVGPETLPPRAIFRFTPPTVARTPTGLGGSLRVLTPDPIVARRAASLPDDPRLRAQWVFGELASIYFEVPGRDRGVSIVLGPDTQAEPRFLRPLLHGISAASPSAWLRPVEARRLFEPSLRPRSEVRTLDDAPPTLTLSDEYLRALAAGNDAVRQLESISPEPSQELGDEIDRLRELLLQSQSRYVADDHEAQLSYVERVLETVGQEFAEIVPPRPEIPITLTAQGGSIPVTIQNTSGHVVRVQVRLVSSGLEFVGGATQEVELSRPTHLLNFPVRAPSTGAFPVHIVVETPLGEEIASTSIIVRSTAYNRIALLVTVGAALFLAAWWSRRFLRRRT